MITQTAVVHKWRVSPGLRIILGFLLIILIGAILLSLPVASVSESLPFLDALFTSVSAVCVTGLSVIEPGVALTLFGQSVLLVLIQIGGLGFMTVTSLLYMAMRRRFSLTDRMAMQESMGESKLQGVVRLTRSAVMITVISEAAGALLLSTRLIPLCGFSKGLYFSIFHSISAFCNAGFDLFGNCNSLGAFVGDPVVLITIMLLITVGGLGFFVILELAGQLKHSRARLSLHTRVVLILSAVLFAAGMLFYMFAEWNNPATLGNMPVGQRILNAAFQSVTTRTAGFAAVPQADFSSGSALITVLLMFIGASPAGTGGGIKTTTIAVLCALVASIIRGSEGVNILHRKLPRAIVMRAIAIAALGMVFVGICTITVTLCENCISASDALFEVVSAFGTVGLSFGITPTLSAASKVVLMLAMFAGRLGLLSLVAALTRLFAGKLRNLGYPEERLMVG